MSDYKFERNFLTDGYTIYDKNRKKVGRADRNFFTEGYTLYDANGKKIGKADRNFLNEGFTIYDTHNKKIGNADLNFWTDGYTMHTSDGKKVDNLRREGCYIATCVYGNYDCPEVWTLRRFRDYYLYNHFLGKCFIKVYYKISPILVKWFGNNKLFKFIWRSFLNVFIKFLHLCGYKNTYYDGK